MLLPFRFEWDPSGLGDWDFGLDNESGGALLLLRATLPGNYVFSGGVFNAMVISDNCYGKDKIQFRT